MIDSSFDALSTNEIVRRRKGDAHAIYQLVFPQCIVADLRQHGPGVHVLDKQFGIDCVLLLRDGPIVTLQEKFRDASSLRYCDFTQEYFNAYGTPFQSLGEWFKLAADFYFYGWENADKTGFAKWLLMDVSRYKLCVQASGGLDKIGRLRENHTHGRATFYGIDPKRIESCFVTDYRKFELVDGAWRPKGSAAA